ncbi:MAG: PfkB family carbohydrate kinase, partial [Oscillospiraceae bacterium]|nr:PfkB family carbohydrate kinase [Oscillospiraceae bacterium]
ETEAEAYSGVPQAGYGDPADWARAAAEGMRRLGAANVIITMADKGAFVSFGGLSEMVPAYSVDPVDSTAAGDSFNAALTMALAEGRPTLEAVSYACAAGALTASREGAQASLPTGEEIKAFIRTAKLKGG